MVGRDGVGENIIQSMPILHSIETTPHLIDARRALAEFKEVHAPRKNYTPRGHLTTEMRKRNGGWRRAAIIWSKPLRATRERFLARAKLRHLLQKSGLVEETFRSTRKIQLPRHRKATYFKVVERLCTRPIRKSYTRSPRIVQRQTCSYTALENSKKLINSLAHGATM